MLPCENSTLDQYTQCKFSETTGGGVFGAPAREIYLCDGERVENKCIVKPQYNFSINIFKLLKDLENKQ